MTNPFKEIPTRRMLALTMLALTVAFFAYDLVVDALFENEFGSWHFIIEAVVFVAVSWTLVVNLKDLAGLRTRLEEERSRNRVLAGKLADGINAQLDDWRLTRSEKEVAWLIIKGFRFAEIAGLRGVKENTTRLQASGLYTKAGVSGRAEFVAEVVHQLLMPVTEETSFSGNAAPPDASASGTDAAPIAAAASPVGGLKMDRPEEGARAVRKTTRH